MVAGLTLALSPAVFAGDAPPTTQEMVGEAEYLARSAHQGDKNALATLRSGVAAKYADAEFGLGEYYRLSKDYAQSVSWFQKSADQGFAGGYYALGIAYESGEGVPQDYAQAMGLYLKATELADAEMKIGLLYAHGRGVRQDYSQAVLWYRKAADTGSVDADLALGSTYETGEGVPRDDAQAMQWYRKAADFMNAQGQYRLGLLYERSKSLQDYKQAVYWYGKAAQQGIVEAQLNLGMLYSNGKGAPADAGRALQLFQMAANQGNGQAQYQLANCFATGAGVRPDPFRAYQWMTIAKASLDGKDPTYSLALEKMKDWEKQLSPTQISQAKKAAAEWLQSHGTTRQ
jgi:TPR repeat protein